MGSEATIGPLHGVKLEKFVKRYQLACRLWPRSRDGFRMLTVVLMKAGIALYETVLVN